MSEEIISVLRRRKDWSIALIQKNDSSDLPIGYYIQLRDKSQEINLNVPQSTKAHELFRFIISTVGW